MVLGITSFWSSCAVGGSFLVFVLFRRPDLVSIAAVAFVAVPVLLLPAYLIPELLGSGWFAQEWLHQNLTGYALFGIPFEDVVWVALAAAVTATLVPWMTSTSLVHTSSRKIARKG
jgi:hypothetical protein